MGGTLTTAEPAVHLHTVGCTPQLPDCPLFFDLPTLAHVTHTDCPSTLKIMSAIMNGGYKVSQSHTSPVAIKTNAPSSFVWDMVRAWEKLHPVHDRHKTGDSPCARILGKAMTHKVLPTPV